MSVTIRKGGLIKPPKPPNPEHPCDLPDPSKYKLGTKISCNDCGRWWRLVWERYEGPYGDDERYLWQKMRKKDRYVEPSRPI